jgi:hypothetical protein
MGVLKILLETLCYEWKFTEALYQTDGGCKIKMKKIDSERGICFTG